MFLFYIFFPTFHIDQMSPNIFTFVAVLGANMYHLHISSNDSNQYTISQNVEHETQAVGLLRASDAHF